MKALALVQARYGATRFPGKCLELIEGVPLLAHVLRRVRASQVAHTVLACPDTPENDAIAALGAAEGVDVYRGSEDDVLGRLYWAAEAHPGYEPLVRITGEDWAKDPRLIDLSLAIWQREHNDQLWVVEYQHLGYRDPGKLGDPILPGQLEWPIGCDVEVFSRGALAEAYKWAKEPDEREHVTLWMWRNMGVTQVPNPTPRPGYNCNTRWTVDYPEDLERARYVYSKLYAQNPTFGYAEIVGAGL